MNRGNRGEAIFITDSDCGTFLDGLTDSCDPFEAVVYQSVLGTEDFVAWMKKKLPQKGQREIPSLKNPHRHISVDNIIGLVAKAGTAPGADPRERKTPHKDLRQMAMELSYRYSNAKQKEIGAIFGVDYSTVSQGRARLKAKLNSSRKLKKQFHRIRDHIIKLSNSKIHFSFDCFRRHIV
jgi:DNA-binding CsgD family transcriptional regulator